MLHIEQRYFHNNLLKFMIRIYILFKKLPVSQMQVGSGPGILLLAESQLVQSVPFTHVLH